MKKKTKKSGKKQGKVGKGHPPEEHQFQPGQSGNPKGKAKGTPNRSTVARLILETKGKPPETILRNLKAMYPKFFEGKSKQWSNELLMTIRIAQKAIMGGDVKAYIALMDSAYGRAKESMELEHKGKIIILDE